ncbi:MAG: EFR1 family ferrodoxin [Spirochaetota bacterium]
MKKAVIHYFTGTGNAEHAAKEAASCLGKNGYTVSLVRVEKGVAHPSDKRDIDIFFFSVYSWSAAVMMKRYMRSLPKADNRPAAVFAVFGTYVPGKGGNPGQGLPQARAILRRRGYDVFLTDGMRYPVNWIQFSPTPDAKTSAVIMRKGDEQVERFVQKVLKRERSFYPCGVMEYIGTKISAVLFGAAGRRLLGKFFAADSSCNGCGLCAQSCPAHTIIMAPYVKKPYWSFNCENCNRCMNICPRGAIQTSLARIIFHCAAGIFLIIGGIKVALYAVRCLDGNPLYFPAAVILCAAAVVIAFLVQGYIFDPVLYCIQSMPGIRKLFDITFTRSFRRYHAPGFAPVMKDKK